MILKVYETYIFPVSKSLFALLIVSIKLKIRSKLAFLPVPEGTTKSRRVPLLAFAQTTISTDKVTSEYDARVQLPRGMPS